MPFFVPSLNRLPSLIFFLQSNLLQREELRARFPGVPGDLVNYFLYVAEEVIHQLVNFLSFFPPSYFDIINVLMLASAAELLFIQTN